MRKIIQIITANILLRKIAMSGPLLFVVVFTPLIVFAQGTAPVYRIPGAPNGSYKLGEFDNVNLFNGNLSFELPLVNVKGRGDVGHQVALTIDGQWDLGEAQDPNGLPGQTMPEYSFHSASQTSFGSIQGGQVELEYNMAADYQDTCEGAGGTVYRIHYIFRLTYVAEDGSKYLLRNSVLYGLPYQSCGHDEIDFGRVFENAESSITFVSDTSMSLAHPAPVNGYLYFGNGTRKRVEIPGPGQEAVGRVIWSEDRNGNRIDFQHRTANNPHTSKIKDSLNREVSIETDFSPPNSSSYAYSNINFKGTGGADRQIKIFYGGPAIRTTQSYDSPVCLTLGQLFNSGVFNANVPCNDEISNSPTSVLLPNGQSYQFKYNVYSQLARVVLPTGGAIEYDYFPLSGYLTFPEINRVKEKRVYDENNVLLGKTVFSFETPNTGLTARPEIWVSVEEFDGGNHRLSKTKHYFYGAVNQSNPEYIVPWWTGKEYKTENYDRDGTTLLRKNEKEWRQKTPAWCYNHPYIANICGLAGNPNEFAPTIKTFVAETRETLADANLVKKTTSINPSNGNIEVDDYGNPVDIWEYDYGTGAPGTFLRRTHTDYVTSSSYTACNSNNSVCIRGLPYQTWTSSDAAGNNKVSLTQIEYDNYSPDTYHASLLSRSSVTGHNSADFGIAKVYRGNATAVTKYSNAANATGAITSYSQFDILGNITKSIDPKGNQNNIGYADNFGSADGEARSNTAPAQLNGSNTFAFPTVVTNPLNWNSYSQVDYFTGLSVNTEDINGVISKTLYDDPLDRPTKAVVAVGTALENQVTTIYDDINRKVLTTKDLNSLNDNLLKIEITYDGFGRTIETKKYETDGNFILTKSIPTLSMQDPDNSIWRSASKSSNPYRPNNGEQPVWTISLVDALGRSIKTITPDGAIAKTEYFGNSTTAIDQAQKPRRSIANGLGLLTRVDEPNSSNQLGTIANPNQPTSYNYDVLGNLVQVTQIGVNAEQCGAVITCSQTRTFQYDSLSRLTSATNPESGTVTYAYDDNGNLISKSQPRSNSVTIVTNYFYDALNRVLTRAYSGESGYVTPAVTYTYDDKTYAKGKLTKISSSISTTEYMSFDPLGRIVRSKQTTDGIEYGSDAMPMTYAYHLSGTLTEQQYPSGRIIKNVIDQDGDLSVLRSKKNANSGYWAYANNLTYNAAGAVTSLRLGNGNWESTQFNVRMQPTQIGLGTTASAANILKLNYSYGAGANNGNVLSQTITVPGLNHPLEQNYSYDALNRILTATEISNSQQAWKQSFIYDRFGNRNFDEVSTTTFSAPKNCVENSQPVLCAADRKKLNPAFDRTNNRMSTNDDYEFDLAGNTISDASRQNYSYDGENKIFEVKDNSNGAILGTYFYDGNGKRVKKIVPNTETTIFVYDAFGKMVAEYSTQLNPVPKVAYITTDPLGSPRLITEENGAIISRQDYHSFGEKIASVGGRASEPGYSAVYNGIRKKFTGYERDDESGLDFAQARTYSKTLGRFMSSDEFSGGPDDLFTFVEDAADNPTFYADLENPQSINKYQYVYNNPYRYIDPDGHAPVRTLDKDEDKNSFHREKTEDDDFKRLKFDYSMSCCSGGRRGGPRGVRARNRRGQIIGGWAAGTGRRVIPRPREPHSRPPDPWITGRDFPGLRDHWRRHAPNGVSLAAYLQSARSHMSSYGFRQYTTHNGQTRVSYVTRTGPDTFILTVTSRDGRTIFTHMILSQDGGPIRGQYLRNQGINVTSYPQDFIGPIGGDGGRNE